MNVRQLVPSHFCQGGQLVPSSYARVDNWYHLSLTGVDNGTSCPPWQN